MSLAAQALYMTVDDYLGAEQSSDIRHEYVAGQMFAMAGAGEAHNRIAGNLFFHLRSATRGTPCGAFISDMKVRVEKHDAFYYPDVLLACDRDDSASIYKQSPCLIAEVLSPSTEVIDRREKLVAYRSLPSLRYYMLVSQERHRVEFYSLGDDGIWRHQVFEQEGELQVQCGDLDIRFSLADVYEDVELAPQG
ncbi:Uma2 family endonuclease [Thiorhodococcus mannitoliphagus]|uniref:Uma2 family endonuclease n=1 Tax=Thiorhodococcus mannitoliphagus TaxID=329406 RepID=A0A6P1DPZ7_9GAMM|nr:Uma2 family endonuclease [Thiorhodococcus mannitoliphagus]NEX19989.1 Uma2 family endonuclease [Thiorhodococcus mannitoliphagus]